MKLLVTVVDRDQATEVTRLFDTAGVTGYSLLPDVLGRGSTGAHLGTRAFPGENAMVLALVSPEQADGLTIALRELKHGLLPAQGLMAFSLDAVPLL